MISPPIVAPQTAPRRGPRQASAAQQNFLANRAGAQPVTPTPPSGKPNQFSASGPGSQPSPSSGAGSSASGVSSIPAASSGGASSTPASLGQVPSGSGMMKRGGRVQNFAAGGATETNQYGSWGGANAADAATGTPNSYSNVAPQPSGISNTQGPFSTTPSPYSATFNPGGGSTPATPTGQLSNGAGGFVAGYVGGVMTGKGEGVGYNNGPAITPQVNNQSNYTGQGPGYSPLSAKDQGPDYSLLGGGDQLNVSNPSQEMAAARGGSIPAPKEEPYRNKWKAKNHAGDNAYKFDDGGDVPDPGGAVPTDPTDPSEMQDTGQGQSGQAGDLGGALSAVQNAYKYGMSLLTGNIGANSQVQASGPPVNGQPSWSEEDQANLDSTNNTLTGMFSGNPNIRTPIGAPPIGPGTVTGGIQGAKMIGGAFGNAMSTPAQAGYTAFQARGGSVPSYQDGGIAVPPAAPQPQQPTPAPAGGGVGGAPPPQIMRYLTGADAAPVPQVMQHMKSLSGHGRAARTVAAGKTPQQQYAILQALRRLSDAASTHAKVSLHGNGRIPASLPHAVMFANKKFEYAPSQLHIQFGLKGKGKPTNKAARGGVIQSFDDGGDVGPDVGMSSSGSGDVGPDPISQMADAGAPITMNVSDLQTGQTQNQDITPAQLQSLTSGTFDSYVAHPTETLSQAVERAQGTEQAGQGGIGNFLSQFNPVSTANAAEAPNTQRGTTTEELQGMVGPSTETGGSAPTPIKATAPLTPWQKTKNLFSGAGASTPEGGESQTNMPEQWQNRSLPGGAPTQGEQVYPDSGPPVTTVKAWDGKSGTWQTMDATEYDNLQGKDPSTPVQIWDATNQTWKPVTTGYFNDHINDILEPGPNQKIQDEANRNSIGASTTNPVEGLAGPGGIVRYGANQGGGASRNAIIAAGQANLQQMNQDYARNRAIDAQEERERERANQSRPQRPPRPQQRVSRPQQPPRPQQRVLRRRPIYRRRADLGTPQAAAQGGSIQARPRRVYGHGHRGLGTYQEMPDGQAQYLGPHNLTG